MRYKGLHSSMVDFLCFGSCANPPSTTFVLFEKACMGTHSRQADHWHYNLLIFYLVLVLYFSPIYLLIVTFDLGAVVRTRRPCTSFLPTAVVLALYVLGVSTSYFCTYLLYSLLFLYCSKIFDPWAVVWWRISHLVHSFSVLADWFKYHTRVPFSLPLLRPTTTLM